MGDSVDTELIKSTEWSIGTTSGGILLPAVIADAGEKAGRRFVEFFTATIRNGNTRPARYAAPSTSSSRARRPCSPPTRPSSSSPASSPRRKSQTAPKAASDDAEEEEPKPTIAQLRDRALIAVMVFSFARVTAALGMKVEDYYTEGRRAWFRLHEKGGKRHEVPAHHNAEDYLDAYIEAAGIAGAEENPPLPLHRPAPQADRPADAPHRRPADDQTPGQGASACPKTSATTPSGPPASPPTWKTAAPSSTPSRSPTTNRPKTTKLYDRTSDQIDLDEIEKIRI